MTASHEEIVARAGALRAAGRLEDALALYRQAVALFPGSAVAEHNLAGALGDAGRWREAEAHIRAVFGKGGDAAQSWLVLARCLQGLGRDEEAERAYREAVRRAPGLHEAQHELAQLVWMRTGDAELALKDLETAIAAAPGDVRLAALKAQALDFMGRTAEGLALLQRLAAAHPRDAYVATLAAHAATMAGDGAGAVALAEQALAAAPGDIAAGAALAEASLAAGDAVRAAMIAEALRAAAPLDQRFIALQAIAWRLTGDARYRALYDYEAFVSAAEIDTPQGWPDLGAYLSDLKSALDAAHTFRTHPFAQSVRHGSQAAHILEIDHPATRALPAALDGPIRRHIAKLGRGDDPLRARNSGGYRLNGLWSIRMKGGGYHVDHVHPQAWISSACYIEAPQRRQGHEGWIKFGEPGIPTRPQLAGEHFIEPKPGRLVLFPSYMWHGTVPFVGDETRMSVAFDLVPG